MKIALSAKWNVPKWLTAQISNCTSTQVRHADSMSYVWAITWRIYWLNGQGPMHVRAKKTLPAMLPYNLDISNISFNKIYSLGWSLLQMVSSGCISKWIINELIWDKLSVLVQVSCKIFTLFKFEGKTGRILPVFRDWSHQSLQPSLTLLIIINMLATTMAWQYNILKSCQEQSNPHRAQVQLKKLQQ